MYYHTTSIPTLENILSGDGRLHTLKQLAELKPDETISVENEYNSRRRRVDAIKKLYAEAVRHGKQVDAVFFTKDKYLPSYGDVLIAKEFKPRALSNNRQWTSIPDERLRKNKAVALGNAIIYVPDNVADTLRSKYQKYNIQGYSEVPVAAVTATDRLLAAIVNSPKLLKGAAASDDVRDVLENYRKAVLVGSSGLGISNSTSDNDIIIPTNTALGRKRLRNRISRQYPDLYISREDEKKTTFSGSINGNDFNIALIPTQYADPFIGGYMSAKDYLDQHEDERERIRRVKRLLTSLPIRAPYKWYKKYVDNQLGISQNYI